MTHDDRSPAPHVLWAALPQAVRERLDAHVLRRARLMAAREVLDAGLHPRPGLYACLDLVHVREEVLADRLVPLPARDADALTARAEALGRRVAALELEWDGDSRGWILVLDAVGGAGERVALAQWQEVAWEGPFAVAAEVAGRLGVAVRGPGEDGPDRP
ncbi:hypothetical protein [Streptomyces sp. NRRL F-5727]|uniref:hypothetical protein n=1 Tax=Streptomyces sp. NRRL F-5727 TaxID=1463871 RepID=UPI00068CCD33|nr:hypothetical protein [Streptomyces sp. NRRL F-5727]